MKRTLLTFVLVLLVVSGVQAQDLLDLRVFPCFDTSSVSFQGVISARKTREDGTRRRDRVTAAFTRMLASSTVAVASHEGHVYVPVRDGEFSGNLKVNNLNNFALAVFHDGKRIYQESFSFPARADYLIISDIDDTILVTEVHSKIKMGINSLFKKTENRKAVEGKPELYRELASGDGPMGKPHFIYLSSSPSFLSRMIKQFIKDNDFPQGTIVLKKSLTSGGLGDHDSHKSAWLHNISQRYHGMPMVLIGDSAEQDPYIYKAFIEEPERISPVPSVIIREVTSKSETIQKLNDFAEQILSRFRTPFLHWDKMENLAEKLKLNGLID